MASEQDEVMSVPSSLYCSGHVLFFTFYSRLHKQAPIAILLNRCLQKWIQAFKKGGGVSYRDW